MESFFQLVSVIFIFVAVLFATYLTTRWVGRAQKNRYAGRNVELIDAGQLSGSKYIQIVRVGKKYLALVVCKDTVVPLGEVNEEDLVLPDDAVLPSEGETFRKILDQAKGILPRK